MARQPLVGRGFFNSRFPDTPHSVGPLWTSDRTVAETSTWQHNRHTSVPPAGFELTIQASERPQTRAATGFDYLFLGAQ